MGSWGEERYRRSQEQSASRGGEARLVMQHPLLSYLATLSEPGLMFLTSTKKKSAARLDPGPGIVLSDDHVDEDGFAGALGSTDQTFGHQVHSPSIAACNRRSRVCTLVARPSALFVCRS